MKELLSNIIAGFIGGLLVYFFQIFKEKKKQKNQIKENLLKSNKILPKNFFEIINTNINKNHIIEIIGLPKYSNEVDETELYGEGEKFIIEIYEFSNCTLNLFYQQNNLIGYIVYNSYHNNIIIPRPIGNNEIILGNYAIDDTFDDNVEIINEISARESWFGVIEYYGRIANYDYICFYGFLNPEKQNENINIEDIKGEIIEGFGKSSKKEIFKYYR